MKPIRLELKARNNRMISLREQLGLTIAEAAPKVGVSYGILCTMEAPGYDPIRGGITSRKGELKESARRASEFYGVAPDFLWPELMRRMTKSKVTREMEFEEIEQLVSPVEMDLLPSAATEDPIVNCDLEKLVALSGLTKREASIIKMVVIEEQGLQEAADAWGISRERTRQIMMRGLKRCREHISNDEAITIFER